MLGVMGTQPMSMLLWVSVSCWTGSKSAGLLGSSSTNTVLAPPAGESLQLHMSAEVRKVNLTEANTVIRLSSFMTSPRGEATLLRHASVQQHFDCIGELIPCGDGGARRPCQLHTRTLMRVWTGST